MSDNQQRIDLVVSGSSTITQQLQWVAFRRVSLKTRASSTGAGILQLVKERRPDAVVLEATLADTSGFDVCRSIKADLGMSDLPVVVVVEGAIKQHMLSSIADSMANEILSAPLSRGQLYEVLAGHLKMPRRSHPRVQVQLPASASNAKGNAIVGELLDLTVSGARMALGAELDPNQSITLEIDGESSGGGKVVVKGKIVWQKPTRQGAEVAVQFDTVDSQNRTRLQQLSSWQVKEVGDRVEVKLLRDLTERTDFNGLKDRVAHKKIDFDLGGMLTINSMGVGSWIRFLQGLPSDVTYRFFRCTAAFCSQASLIDGMLGRGELMSLYAPYYCPTCGHEGEREMQVADLGKTFPPVPPKMDCPSCEATMEFDDVPERFFYFLYHR